MSDAAPWANRGFRRSVPRVGGPAIARLALLAVSGCLWLVLAALPALADGGPHVAIVNSGTGSYSTGSGLSSGILTSDNCAGCHRAHTAKAFDVTTNNDPALCLACHGTAGTGATTNVQDGAQYNSAAGGGRGSAILGALRAGGFDFAYIGSSSPSRYRYGTGDHDFVGKVPVLPTKQPATSHHMNLSSPTQGTVWGSGAIGSGAGQKLTLGCTSCHNPHGNNQYRILNPIPGASSDNTTDTYVAPATGVGVTDAALPTGTQVRNYTVIQPANLASDITTSATSGDYWRRRVPWTSTDPSLGDRPNGLTAFYGQITPWCAQCHRRYMATSPSAQDPVDPATGLIDPVYKYRHTTSARPECTQCHVAHGSNALMPGYNSLTQALPDGTVPASVVVSVSSGDSRLLKVDNRGTCQMCHDPTRTVTVGTYSGPLPTPGAP